MKPSLTIVVVSLLVLLAATIPSSIWFTAALSEDQQKDALFFSSTYEEARARFLSKCEGIRQCRLIPLNMSSNEHPHARIDVAWIGHATNPSKVLVVSSGVHGVEGYAGAAIQLSLMSALQGKAASYTIPDGHAVILVHLINPFGMRNNRRFNEENVDLNRNFLAVGEEYAGAHPSYEHVEGIVRPLSPVHRSFAGFCVDVARAFMRVGYQTFQQASVGGQYELKDSIFYGGDKLQNSAMAISRFLKEHLLPLTMNEMVWLDLHTGLGKWADYELLPPSDIDPSTLFNMLSSNERVSSKIHTRQPGSSVSYKAKGHMGYFIYETLTSSVQDFAFCTQEFGTYRQPQILHGLVEENRAHYYSPKDTTSWYKLHLKELFAPASQEWRAQVVSGGREVVNTLIEYLWM